MRQVPVCTVAVMMLTFVGARNAAQGAAEDRIVEMLRESLPYHRVSPDVFEQLGVDLPDGGAAVKALADAAPGGAFDPRALEALPADKLGYRAKWHVARYKVYGLDWDISGLQLTPARSIPNMPTLAIVNGGSANWYEFFVDPLNRPGLGQFLAQKHSRTAHHHPWQLPAWRLDREAARKAHPGLSAGSRRVRRRSEAAQRDLHLSRGHGRRDETHRDGHHWTCRPRRSLHRRRDPVHPQGLEPEEPHAGALDGLGHRWSGRDGCDAQISWRAHRRRLSRSRDAQSASSVSVLARVPRSAEPGVECGSEPP